MPSVKSAFRKLTGARRRRQPSYDSDDEEYDYDCPRVGFDPDDCRVTSHNRDYYPLPNPADDRDPRAPGAFPDEGDEVYEVESDGECGEEMEYEGGEENGEYEGGEEMEYQQQQNMVYQHQQAINHQHQQPRTYQHQQAPHYQRQRAPNYQPQPAHYQRQRAGPQVLHYQRHRQEQVRMFATSGPLDDEYELGFGNLSPYIVAEEREEQKGMNMAGAWVD